MRLRASTLVGVQRPLLRAVANRRRAQVARRYLARHGLRPRAVIASTTAPMLDLIGDLPGLRVYYATDDFVEAASLWKVSKRYLSKAREQNLRAAEMVLAVTPELARHLQRGPAVPGWLPNGADLARFTAIEKVVPASVPLRSPVAGVIGQFNSRTDLAFLDSVRRSGNDLLLVGPRWFVNTEDEEAFERLIVAPGVHWIDELPREELAPYLRALHVGLTPYADSMFNRRSYPLKTLEYLAAGVPVVTTAVAPVSGLDPRYVNTEQTTASFSQRVSDVASTQRASSDVRRSVESDGWDSRAALLLTWLRQERNG